MMKLFDSAFSPFARKVRMVLEHKGLTFEVCDGLVKSNHAALEAVSGRVEVPVLVEGDVVVVNSADIVAYLDAQYPAKPVYPASVAARVHARAWERTADSFVDPILINISYWLWADREDSMPDGLLQAARSDMTKVYDALERDLASRDFISGSLSIADIALFPHMAAARPLDVGFAPESNKNISAWLERMRALPIVEADRKRTRAYVAMHAARELVPIRDADLARMTVQNADLLSRVPKSKQAGLVPAAQTQTEREFRETIAAEVPGLHLEEMVHVEFWVPGSLLEVIDRCIEKAKTLNETESRTAAVEAIWGVAAERKALESIAPPLASAD